MQLTINDTDSKESLLAAAEFLKNLASPDQMKVTEDIPSLTPHIQLAPEPAAEVPAPAPAGDVELDSSGLPWDERIHSAGKSKIGNGTWKLKRGVDKALVEQVQAEHMQAAPVNDPSVFAAPQAPAEEKTGPTQWPDVLTRAVPKQMDGSYDVLREQQFFSEHGLTGQLPILATRPDLFDAFIEAMGL